MASADGTQTIENLPVITAESDVKLSPQGKADIKIIVKQPKVQKPKSDEKKPRTEGQLKALEKMKEALAIKRQAKMDSKKAEEEAERKHREDAVRLAEEEAKKITDNVEVQKVRGRKIGTKNPPKVAPLDKIPDPLPPKTLPPLTHAEYAIATLRKKGVHIPDNVTPYMLKMIMSRYR